MATKLAMLMIEPPPPLIMAGMAYLQPRKTPRTLTAITLSQVATSVSTTEWSASGITPGVVVEAVEPAVGRDRVVDHGLRVGLLPRRRP